MSDASELRANMHREGEHYVWDGPRNFGAGAPRLGKRYARNVAWEVSIGPVPPGMAVQVTCEHPSCVNPRHGALVPVGSVTNPRKAAPKKVDLLDLEERVARLEARLDALESTN